MVSGGIASLELLNTTGAEKEVLILVICDLEFSDI